MGSTMTPTTERPAEYVRRMLRGWTDSTVLRLEEFDNQFYLAVRLDRLTDETRQLGYRPGDVTGVVILAASDGAAMHERIIGEEEGPVYWAASHTLIGLLSPLPTGARFDYARKWRDRCIYERTLPGSFTTARKIAHR
jgi:hypothetical protein